MAPSVTLDRRAANGVGHGRNVSVHQFFDEEYTRQHNQRVTRGHVRRGDFTNTSVNDGKCRGGQTQTHNCSGNRFGLSVAIRVLCIRGPSSYFQT